MDDNDFQVRLVQIENGFLVKRLGSVWYCDGIVNAINQIQALILEWDDPQ